MGRLAGFSGREVERVARVDGWSHQRSSGSHRVYRKTGNPRNLTIPDHSNLNEGTLRSLLKIMDMSVEEFLAEARK